MEPKQVEHGPIADIPNRLAVTIAELALLAMMVFTVYAVVARYVFRSPSMYAVEVSSYLMLVIAWCSVGYVYRVNRHVSMEALTSRLGGAAKNIADIIAQCAVIIFCAALIWSGGRISLTAFEKGYRSASLLKFPMWIAYALIVLGGVLLLVVAIQRLKNGLPHKSHKV